MTFETFSEPLVKLINNYIDGRLDLFRQSVSQRFSPLIDAMEYSVADGGKRLRPMLALSAGKFLGLKPEDILPAACAIEFIHSYSLIHDDLPAIDDDDMRRGKPSSHKKWGEDVAILTGDALLTHAFSEMMALRDKFEAGNVLSAVDYLSTQAGVKGMLGGQFLDVTSEVEEANLPQVEFIHIHKTGALILLSVLLPAKLIPLAEEKRDRLRKYGEAVGLAFQISDDILDAEASVRYSRGPRKKPKPSYSQLMGHSEMREKLNMLLDNAVRVVEPEGDKAESLVCIAEFIRTRRN